MTLSPFKCMGDLCFTCRKFGPGHPRVMIYINFVELLFLMFHSKFKNKRPSDSGEDFFKGFGQAISEEKIFEMTKKDADRWTPEYGQPISSPCESSAQVR